MDSINVYSSYNKYKELGLKGLFFKHSDVLNILKAYDKIEGYSIKNIGYSVENRSIDCIKFGQGKIRIMIWSQMHGNEPTGTGAMFDLLNYFKANTELLKICNILYIPMLNPDGVEYFTRVNSMQIDINRDAVALQTPESKVLRSVLNEFNPNFCLNLHDQRPIYNIGDKPSVMSFLAPSEDKTRKVTDTRVLSMNIISAINDTLKQIIPNKIGRYSDEFYPTATGDNFQKLGYPTILFESGWEENDEDKSKTRAYTFISILKAIDYICNIGKSNYSVDNYLSIPENDNKMKNIIIKNVILEKNKTKVTVDVSLLKILNINNLQYDNDMYNIDSIGDLSNCYAYNYIEFDSLSEEQKGVVTNVTLGATIKFEL